MHIERKLMILDALRDALGCKHDDNLQLVS